MQSRDKRKSSYQASQGIPSRYQVVLSRAAAKDLKSLSPQLLDQLETRYFKVLADAPPEVSADRRRVGLTSYMVTISVHAEVIVSFMKSSISITSY